MTILYLFVALNDFGFREAQLDDAENMNIIRSTAETIDMIVYASGVGKARNKQFQERQT